MIYSLGDRKVEFHGEDWFIADNATVIGSVVLEQNASIWFNAVVRGDNDVITIGENSNIQDGSILHTDPGILLTIGRDEFVKGYGLLARAWASSGATRRGAVWVTVGGAAPGRTPGRVVTGPVPHREVVDWIHASDLGALPSYYEGCSVALLEMLAGGPPTLAHNVGNAAEVIRDPAGGRILPPSPTTCRRPTTWPG